MKSRQFIRKSFPTMNLLQIVLFASVGLTLASFAAEGEEPSVSVPGRIALWAGEAPVGDGSSEAANAFITVHRPAKPNGASVIVCPGGGYGGLVKGPEGHGIARWLKQHGLTGIVLEYRLPKGRPEVPLLDARRAIRTVRSQAATWGLDPDRVGIMGFSAGGHLASTAATQFDAGNPAARDPVNVVSSRPDFSILVYPVISMGAAGHQGSTRNLLGENPDAELLERFSSEKQVTDRTPPAFLAHALDDRVVPAGNSERYHDALRERRIPTEYLELPSGGHGLNGYQGPNWDAWQAAALKWLAQQDLLEPIP